MADLLEKKGIFIDEKKLEKILGVKVFRISALKETGMEEIIKEIDRIEDMNRTSIFDANIENGIKLIEKQIPQEHKRFIAVKLLEKDQRFLEFNNKEIDKEREALSKLYDTDMEEVIATERYDFIEKVKKEVCKKKDVGKSASDILDKIFLNKWLAFPIFIAIMFLVYYLSVGVVGKTTTLWAGNILDSFGVWTRGVLLSLGTSNALNSLVVDGIFAGVGAVLRFIPQLAILFLCISLLETTGYMSRIALLLDKLFRSLGLSGKSLIPFIIGSGCSVPGIMGTRIIENEDERKMTAMLVPFIPCSAKLPIIALFSGYFFREYSVIVSASLYFFAIIIIIALAFILSRTKFKNTSSSFISELPEYKTPSAKYVVKDVWDKVIAFIKRAGSVILICSIVIWFLISFSFNFQYGVDIEESILASIGKTISWFFYPMLGQNNWGATVSAIQGLVAKEQVVSSMAVISGLAEDVKEGNKIFAKGTIFEGFTASAAYAFMIFNLFSAPCFGAIGAMRRELGSAKKMLKTVCTQTVCAWVLATIIYQIGSRIENRTFNLGNFLIILGLAGIVVIIIINSVKKDNKDCINCPYCEKCK